MKPVYTVAVRSLVEFSLRSGNLEFGFISSARSIDAIRAHQVVQKSRPTNYRPEVTVEYIFDTSVFSLKIGGRIDGVYESGETAIVEEIKTTTRELTYFDNNENQLHWGQLKLYAFIFASHHQLETIEAHLTYYQLDSGTTKTYQRHFGIEFLKSFFDKLINCYLEWMQTIDACRLRRNETAAAIVFPYPAYRPGQRQLAVNVYRTIKNIETRNQLLFQAPTGIGKTMGVLFPAIKAFAEALCDKIFFLTARTTGRVAAEKSLDILRANGLRIKSITLAAKEKICTYPGQACHPDECSAAEGHYDRINEALTDIYHHDSFTPELITEYALRHRVCPFEFALDLSLWSDIIICDYNYVFDPRVYLKRFFNESPDDYIFLVDEAHNLTDRSREMFSATIRKQEFLDIRKLIGDKLPQVKKSLTKINTRLLNNRRACASQNGFMQSPLPPEPIYSVLNVFLRVSEKWLALNEKTPFRDDLLTLYFEVHNFLKIAELYSDAYTTVFNTEGKNLSVKLFCIDPSENLNQVLKRCRTAIFFSATLTPQTYFKYILGCDATANMFSLPSPFPKTNLGLFANDKISTLFKQRNETAEAVASMIVTFILARKGNYLIYFPSYAYMTKIYELVEKKADNVELLLQTPAMTEFERHDFLNCFQDRPERTTAGFAVMGGIFGEGIDLVGDRLIGSVIVGVGLPAISRERDILKKYFTDKFNMGFEYAYLYPGINRVLQAAGRVIRTETDRGVVLLIDQRYHTYRYRSLLPPEWRPERTKNHRHLATILNGFWSEGIVEN